MNKSMSEEPTKPETVVVQPKKAELQVQPKRSCRHCQGRGYIGTDTATGKKIVCRCVKKDFERVNKLQKERDAKLKASKVTANKGWDAPKAPVGNPAAVPA